MIEPWICPCLIRITPNGHKKSSYVVRNCLIFIGSGGGTRTHDLRIMNPTL